MWSFISWNSILHLEEREILLPGPVSLLNAILEEKKQTHLFWRCWLIYLFSLVKKLFVGIFGFFLCLFQFGESLSLLRWCVAEPFLLWQSLLVKEGLENQCARFWVGAVSATTSPPMWGASPSTAHLQGLVTITFPVITGTYTRLVTLISKHMSS